MKRVISDHNGAHTINLGSGGLRRHLVVVFEPEGTHTLVAGWVAHTAGRERARRMLFADRLDTTVADLRGLSGADATILLCRVLLQRADTFDAAADPTAVGPGAPEGATGRAWTDTPLPGL